MISRLKDKLRALTREAIADVLALEAERDALRARSEKAEREADRYKHDATKAAAERDAWRSRALKAESDRGQRLTAVQRAEASDLRRREVEAPAPSEAEAEDAVRVAFAPVSLPPEHPHAGDDVRTRKERREAAQIAPVEKPTSERRDLTEALGDPSTHKHRTSKLRIPAPAAREEQRRREAKATRAVGCPTCDASPGEDCEGGYRRGPYHPDRWTEGKRRLTLADGALAIECPDCKAEPGAWCVVDGRKGLHKSRENESKKE